MERNAAYTQVYFQSSGDQKGGGGAKYMPTTSQQVFLKSILVNNTLRFSFPELFFCRRKSIRAVNFSPQIRSVYCITCLSDFCGFILIYFLIFLDFLNNAEPEQKSKLPVILPALINNMLLPQKNRVKNSILLPMSQDIVDTIKNSLLILVPES